MSSQTSKMAGLEPRWDTGVISHIKFTSVDTFWGAQPRQENNTGCVEMEAENFQMQFYASIRHSCLWRQLWLGSILYYAIQEKDSDFVLCLSDHIGKIKYIFSLSLSH